MTLLVRSLLKVLPSDSCYTSEKSSDPEKINQLSGFPAYSESPIYSPLLGVPDVPIVKSRDSREIDVYSGFCIRPDSSGTITSQFTSLLPSSVDGDHIVQPADHAYEKE